MAKYKKALGALVLLAVLALLGQQVRAACLLSATQRKFAKVSESCRLANCKYGDCKVECPGLDQVLRERDQILKSHRIAMYGEWWVSLPYEYRPETSTIAVYY